MSTAAIPVRAGGRPPPSTSESENIDDAALQLILAATSSQQRLYLLSRSYLGGKKFWHHDLESRSDIHSAILGGVTYGSLNFLLDSVKWLEVVDLANVLGLSTRTLRRQSETPDKLMPPDLASKAWMLAETLAKGTQVFGGKAEAERWMSKAAMGLDGRRPIDLLQTVQGAELVNDFLTRLEYGVYS